MATKVKGLLKGLRYISQIFDEKEEDEIQIGFPTDVKHVAHIGWDGPSANTPSWMTDYKTESEPPSGAVQSIETQDKKSKFGGSRNNKDIPTPRSRHDSLESHSQPNSPTRRSSDGSKQSRRHRSSDASVDSGSTRTRRQSRHSNNGAESQSNDMSPAAAVPRSSRRRKTKTTSGDGSTRSSVSSSKEGSMTDISLPEIGSDL